MDSSDGSSWSVNGAGGSECGRSSQGDVWLKFVGLKCVDVVAMGSCWPSACIGSAEWAVVLEFGRLFLGLKVCSLWGENPIW